MISVLLAIKYTDQYLRLLTVAMFGLLIISMVVFILFGGTTGVAHAAFFLWGLSFGPLVTLLQAAVSRQVLSIMLATLVAGLLLGRYSAMSLSYFAIVLAIPGMIISLFAKKTLG